MEREEHWKIKRENTSWYWLEINKIHSKGSTTSQPFLDNFCFYILCKLTFVLLLHTGTRNMMQQASLKHYSKLIRTKCNENTWVEQVLYR